jgi:type VI secretion system protein ImpF
MSDARPREVLRPSLLDRLTATPEAARSRGLDLRIGLRELRNEVRRDLERLLDTRTLILDDLVQFPQARASVLAYGLADFAPMTHASADDRRRICDMIADSLRRLEPRLDPKSIAVTVIARASEDGPPPSPRLDFRVSAILHVEPIREPVRFDTSFDLERGSVEVTESE